MSRKNFLRDPRSGSPPLEYKRMYPKRERSCEAKTKRLDISDISNYESNSNTPSPLRHQEGGNRLRIFDFTKKDEKKLEIHGKHIPRGLLNTVDRDYLQKIERKSKKSLGIEFKVRKIALPLIKVATKENLNFSTSSSSLLNTVNSTSNIQDTKKSHHSNNRQLHMEFEFRHKYTYFPYPKSSQNSFFVCDNPNCFGELNRKTKQVHNYRAIQNNSSIFKSPTAEEISSHSELKVERGLSENIIPYRR